MTGTSPCPLFLPGSAATLRWGPPAPPLSHFSFLEFISSFRAKSLPLLPPWGVEEGQEGWGYTGLHAKWRWGGGDRPVVWAEPLWVLPQVEAPPSPTAPLLLPRLLLSLCLSLQL